MTMDVYDAIPQFLIQKKDEEPLDSSFVQVEKDHMTIETHESHELETLKHKFHDAFQTFPDAIIQVPGRVNIIGEHIDYEGFGVLPMAISQHINFAVKVHHEHEVSKKIRMVNGKGDKYPNIEIDLKEDPYQLKNINLEQLKWTDYFLCGYKGYFDYLGNTGTTKSMDILVTSNLPPSSGLSSSSAFVVGSFLTTAYANQSETNPVPTRQQIAQLTTKAEHYIGTIGGGMDQTIACLGEQGVARYITFEPIATIPVAIPDNCVLVVANTLREAEKAQEGKYHFNKRVVECTLASMYISKSLGYNDWAKVRTLSEAKQVASEVLDRDMDLVGMESLVEEKCKEDIYTKRGLEKFFGLNLESTFRSSNEAIYDILQRSDSFKLKQRALHVYSEAARVIKFRDLCNDNQRTRVRTTTELVRTLGQLMNESHDSCNELYECSCDELNDLVSFNREAGALGCRLTGAGWGGCTISLIVKGNEDAFLEKLEDYYKAKHLSFDEAVFVSEPSTGARINVWKVK